MTGFVHPLRALAAAGALALHASAGPPPAGPGAAGLLARTPVLGFGINAHHIGDLGLYLRSVDAIADLGANTLLLATPMFQEHVDSSEIRLVPDKCPTREQLEAILRRARARGLQTMLLPIVLIESPGDDDWRGVLRPADLDAWWASYQRFMDYYVDLAVSAGVDVLSVGSELNTTEDQADRWRHVIDRVRERFGGRLTYTANWDRYDKVALWPLVDFISVSSYFELATDPDVPVGQLTTAWALRRDRLLRFARDAGRPILLMELGYPTLPTAAVHPWNYVDRDETGADPDAQARCYRAFFDAWTDSLVRPGTPAAGFNCYCWDPYHRGGSGDTGYGVRGKPALEVIRAGFERIRSASGTPATP